MAVSDFEISQETRTHKSHTQGHEDRRKRVLPVDRKGGNVVLSV